MANTIFFSWQSDTPNRTGRTFLEKALSQAIGALQTDAELQEAERDLEIDRDTQGVPGSPRIVDTIFGKIDIAAAFVADVTFVGNRSSGRPVANPNVLIEYGWALKSRTYERVIAVMNTAYGHPSAETLPFDMAHIRWPITYELAADASAEAVSAARTKLAKTLEGALRAVLRTSGLATAPALFVRRTSDGSPGRFRATGERLAYAEPPFGLGQAQAVYLADGPVAWMRMMPIYDPGRTWNLSELQAASADNFVLRPFSATRGPLATNRLRDVDGFGTRDANSLAPDGLVRLVSFAFETGEIWGVDAYSQGASRDFIIYHEDELALGLENYREFLVRLGLKPPFLWVVGLEETRERALPPPNDGNIYMGRSICVADEIIVEGTISPGQSGIQSLRPFIERVHSLCGRPPPPAVTSA